MPWGDWQFYLVTALAALSAGWVLRCVVRRPRRAARRARRASLTIEGEKV